MHSRLSLYFIIAIFSSQASSEYYKSIPNGQITKDVYIGKGIMGKVYEGTYLGAPVAVKECYLRSLLDYLKESFKPYHEIRHPNIVLFYGVVDAPGKFKLVTERLPQNMSNFYNNPENTYGWDFIHRVMTEITLGLKVIHGHNYAHKNLKSKNVFFTNELSVKIGDFELSKIKLETESSGANPTEQTVRWRAPETCTREYARVKDTLEAQQRADMYSLGLVFWELASRKKPFLGHTEPSVLQILNVGTREIIDESWPHWFKEILKNCWNFVPSTRPNADAILDRLKDPIVSQALEARKTEERVIIVENKHGKQTFYMRNNSKIARVLNVDSGTYEKDIVQWAGDKLSTAVGFITDMIKLLSDVLNINNKTQALEIDTPITQNNPIEKDTPTTELTPVKSLPGDLPSQIYSGSSSDTDQIIAGLSQLNGAELEAARREIFSNAVKVGNKVLVEDLLPLQSPEVISKYLSELDPESDFSLKIAKKIIKLTDDAQREALVPFSVVTRALEKAVSGTELRSGPEAAVNKREYFEFFLRLALDIYRQETTLYNILGEALCTATYYKNLPAVKLIIDHASYLITDAHREKALERANSNGCEEILLYLTR